MKNLFRKNKKENINIPCTEGMESIEELHAEKALLEVESAFLLSDFKNIFFNETRSIISHLEKVRNNPTKMQLEIHISQMLSFIKGCAATGVKTECKNGWRNAYETYSWLQEKTVQAIAFAEGKNIDINTIERNHILKFTIINQGDDPKERERNFWSRDEVVMLPAWWLLNALNVHYKNTAGPEIWTNFNKVITDSEEIECTKLLKEEYEELRPRRGVGGSK